MLLLLFFFSPLLSSAFLPTLLFSFFSTLSPHYFQISHMTFSLYQFTHFISLFLIFLIPLGSRINARWYFEIFNRWKTNFSFYGLLYFLRFVLFRFTIIYIFIVIFIHVYIFSPIMFNMMCLFELFFVLFSVMFCIT